MQNYPIHCSRHLVYINNAYTLANNPFLIDIHFTCTLISTEPWLLTDEQVFMYETVQTNNSVLSYEIVS